MYRFSYDYIKPKYGDREKFYTDTDSFVIHIIAEHYFEGIAGDVMIWLDTSDYEENDKRPLLTGKNKKKLVFFKDELTGKIMVEVCAFRGKTWGCRMDDNSKKKKAKGTKKAIIKRELMFENYQDSLFNNAVISRLQQRIKSYNLEMYTEEVNKVGLNIDHDERLQTFDRVTIFPQETCKECEHEIYVACTYMQTKYKKVCEILSEKILSKI